MPQTSGKSWRRSLSTSSASKAMSESIHISSLNPWARASLAIWLRAASMAA